MELDSLKGVFYKTSVCRTVPITLIKNDFNVMLIGITSQWKYYYLCIEFRKMTERDCCDLMGNRQYLQ